MTYYLLLKLFLCRSCGEEEEEGNDEEESSSGNGEEEGGSIHVNIAILYYNTF